MNLINAIGSYFKKFTAGFSFGIPSKRINLQDDALLEIQVQGETDVLYDYEFQPKSGILAHLDDIYPPVRIKYATSALMLADQASHEINYLYYVVDENTYYEYLGTTLGTLDDYNAISAAGNALRIIDEEDVELPFQPKLKFDRLTVTDEPLDDRIVVQRPSDTKIRLSTDIPINPLEGDEWTNSENWKTYKFYNGYWVEVSGGGSSGSGEGHTILDEDENILPTQPNLKFERLIVTDDFLNNQTVVQRPSDTKIRTSSTLPLSPLEGDEWTNSETWQTYKFYDGFWVEIPSSMSSGSGGGGGGTTYVHPNHFGDVASLSDGLTTIQPQTVTYAKIQNVTGNRLLGRLSTIGTVEELTSAQVKTLVNYNLQEVTDNGSITTNRITSTGLTNNGSYLQNTWGWTMYGRDWLLQFPNDTHSSTSFIIRNTQSVNPGGMFMTERGSTIIRARGDSVTDYYILRLQGSAFSQVTVFDVANSGYTKIGILGTTEGNKTVDVYGRVAHADAINDNESVTLGQMNDAISGIGGGGAGITALTEEVLASGTGIVPASITEMVISNRTETLTYENDDELLIRKQIDGEIYKIKRENLFFSGVIDLGDVSGIFNVPLEQGTRFRCRMIGNATINISTPFLGQDYVLEITREANYTLTWTASKFRFPLGYTPILTNTVTNGTDPEFAVDIITGLCLVPNRLDIVITPDIRNN